MSISSQWRKKLHRAELQQDSLVMTWTVVYDDQDSEDFTTPEMEKWVIDHVDGTTVTITYPMSQLADENPTDQAHIDTTNIGIANEHVGHRGGRVGSRRSGILVLRYCHFSIQARLLAEHLHLLRKFRMPSRNLLATAAIFLRS